VYRPEQEGLYFPEPPTFESAAAERRHRQERLAASCRILYELGYEYGFAGHLTVRDPEHPELFWTNPFAMTFSQVIPEGAGSVKTPGCSFLVLLRRGVGAPK